MATKRCPSCKLINPGTTAVCDCGWSFVDGAMSAPRLSAEREDESERERERRSRGSVQIGTGVLFVLAGIVITAVTYGGASSSGGGTYVIAYGPMVVGVVMIIRGLLTKQSPDRS